MSVSSGWGRFTWGQAYWNRDAVLATGWGAKSWNDSEWGNLADETVSLTGVSSTTSMLTSSCSSTNADGSSTVFFTPKNASSFVVMVKPFQFHADLQQQLPLCRH